MGGFSGLSPELLQALMGAGGQQSAQQMSQQGQFNPAGVQAAGPQPFSFAPIPGGVGINLLNALANAGKAATYVAEGPREREADDARAQQLYETKQKMALAAGEFGQREKDRAAQAATQQAEFGQREKDRGTQLDIAKQGRDLEKQKLDEEKRYHDIQGAKPQKPDTPEQQFIDWYLKGHPDKNIGDAVTAYAKAHEKPGQDIGTWTLQSGTDGKPILFNTKTGNTRAAPAGIQTKEEQKQQQAIQGSQTDINFANNYAQSKKFDGPHDEALIEKFFDMTKPSSGFRMTQPQIDMALHARSALQGIVAQGKHFLSPNAPYLDDTQRQNIVQTMNDVMSASQSARSPQGTTSNPFAPFGGQVRAPQQP